MKLSELWHREFVVDGICGLCGNHGIIDTHGIETAAGKPTGGRFYCICPNGRAVKRAESGLEYQRGEQGR